MFVSYSQDYGVCSHAVYVLIFLVNISSFSIPLRNYFQLTTLAIANIEIAGKGGGVLLAVRFEMFEIYIWTGKNRSAVWVHESTDMNLKRPWVRNDWIPSSIFKRGSNLAS